MDSQKSNKTYGYCRISTKDQNSERQRKALLEVGVPERDILTDEKSGKDFSRDSYILLKNQLLRNGDTLVITELDRFGRNYEEIKQEWKELVEMGVNIIVLDMPIISTGNKEDTTKQLISDIVFYLLAYIAEKEREKIKERQRQGIAIAKAEGKYKGRKKIESEDFDKIYSHWKSGEITAKTAMELLKFKPNTFYRRVHEYEAVQEVIDY